MLLQIFNLTLQTQILSKETSDSVKQVIVLMSFNFVFYMMLLTGLHVILSEILSEENASTYFDEFLSFCKRADKSRIKSLFV